MRNEWIVDAAVQSECGSMSCIQTQTNMYKNVYQMYKNVKKQNQIKLFKYKMFKGKTKSIYTRIKCIKVKQNKVNLYTCINHV